MSPWRLTRRLASYAFALRAEDAELAQVADSLFSAAAAPPDAVPGACFTLTRRGGGGVLLDAARPACAADDLAGLFAAAEWHLTRCAMQALTGYLQVHAATVVVDGGAILAAGPPESGKTSLALGLAVAGGALAGDEVALLDPQSARVTPFPRDLIVHDGTARLYAGRLPCIRVPAWKTFPGYVHAAPHELGLRTAQGPALVRRLVFPVRRPSGTTQCRPLGPAEAARRLLEQVFSLPQPGAAGLEMIGRLAEECAPLEVSFCDADAAARDLLCLPANG